VVCARIGRKAEMRSVDKGMVQGNFSTIMKIQQTLEREGISFIADPGGVIGVRLAALSRDVIVQS